jgi:hypothetical protein
MMEWQSEGSPEEKRLGFRGVSTVELKCVSGAEGKEEKNERADSEEGRR